MVFQLELTFEDGRSECRAFSLPVLAGRGQGCSLQLKSWRVAKQHARFVQKGKLVFLEDLGSLAGTFVNGRRIAEYGPLVLEDEIILGPCRMRVLALPPDLSGSAGMVSRTGTFAAISEPLAGMAKSFSTTAALYSASQSDNDQNLENNVTKVIDVRLRRRLHKALLDALDLRRRDILSLSDEALRSEAETALSALLADDPDLPEDVDREMLLRQVVDEAVGLGPLESLLADPSVSEIMVNSHEDIYVERAGRLQHLDMSFSSDQAVLAIIDRVVAPLGRRVDESSPMVDARLRDGSRVNAVIPPIALRGPCLTIRKFPTQRLNMDDLIAVGSLDRSMAEFLGCCVRARKSVLVSGGTGSGKTTLLNILSNCIPAGERLITIEDAAELRLNHAHLVALEARPSNTEGKGRVEIRDLVRNALRMRPDRVIVGECRGAEAFDMLAAMNTGHEGSLTTLHANSPRDALARLETMILMAGMDLPLAAIREHIASAVDLIIQQTRLSDGRRLVTSIVEITGMEAGRIQTQELFRYCGDGQPRFEGCGVQPECFRSGEEAVPLEWLTQVTYLSQAGLEPTWPS